MAYLLDTNVFIEAKNHYYGFNICPGFWTWLDHAHAKGLILSIKQVRDELMGRQDRLTNWCKSRSKMFVDTNDEKTYEKLALLTSWVVGNYADAAQAKFLGDADFILVGYADAYDHTVVTTEIAASGKAVKIPNACKAMNVPWMNPFQMLEAEKTKFYFPI
jgi:hypothetical protein